MGKSDSKTKWEEGKKKASAIKETLQSSLQAQDNEKSYAKFAYTPFLGPIIVFLFKKGQKLSRLHAQNALYLQVCFIVILLFIWLISNIPVLSTIFKVVGVVPFVSNALLYVSFILFAGCSVYGAWQGSKGKVWVTPYLYSFINKYAARLNNASAGNSSQNLPNKVSK